MAKYSVRRPFTVLVAVVLTAVLGVVSFMNLKTDLLPSLELPYILVMTTAPGQSPSQVESSVTQPLEQALSTVSGLENMQSISGENVSVIVMEFSQDINMDSAMIEMSNNVDMVKGSLPETVSSPTLMKINPDMLPVQVISAKVDGMDIKQLSEYVETELAPHFERLNGVATVDVSGMVEDYIEITLDQSRIDKINDDILKAVDSSLYDAKKELDSAQQEIKDGKKQLEQAQQEAFDKLSQGASQLDAGVAQLTAITSQADALTAKKALLEGAQKALDGLKQINDGLTQIQQGIDGLNMSKTLFDALASFGIDENMTLEQVISFLDGIIAADPSQSAVITPVKTGIQALISQGIVTADTTVAQSKEIINTQISNLESQKSSLESQKTQLVNSLKEMGISDEVINSADSGMLKTQIDDLTLEITQAQFLKKQMENTVNQLKESYAQLEKAKMEAVSQMAVGTARLNSAQAQIDSGLKEFETARDEALKNANISSLVNQSMINNILTAQNFSMPAGYINSLEGKITVKVGEQFGDIDSLSSLLLVDMGIDGVDPIYLKDVADIQIKDNSDESFVKVNGADGVIISIQKSSVASTNEVSSLINQKAKQLMEENANLTISSLMDQGDYINMVVDSVMSNLIYGGIIALIVLIIFLKDFRPTLVIGLSIPISFMFAVVLMYFSGVTLNIVSISGLALAVGMLVDNSIVVIENIYRLQSLGYNRVKAAVMGAKQVGGAIAASTLTTICVFLPIVFTQGLTRQLFTDMGLTIAYALIASLIVAMTFVPCMASTVLGSEKKQQAKFFNKLLDIYQKALNLNLKHKWAVIVITLFLLCYSVISAFSMPMTFIPSMDSTQMSMTLTMPKETSDSDLYAAGEEIMNTVKNIQDVETVSVMSSSGSVNIMGMGSSSSEKTLSFYVVLRDDKTISNNEAAQLIKDSLPAYSENLKITTDNMDMSMLTGSGITVSVKGSDFDTLAQISQEISDILLSVEGVETAAWGGEDANTELRIQVDKNKAMEYSLTTAQIYQTVAQSITESTQTTSFTFGQDSYDAYIKTNSTYTAENVENIPVATTTDEDGNEKDVLLGEVADVVYAQSPNTINRDNRSRTYTVNATIAEGYNASLVGRQAEKLLADYQVKEGYTMEIGGENQAIMEAVGDMLLMILLAVIFIYLIMVAQFQSLLSPFIVLFTIPLAFTGGLLALQITGTALSVVSLIGFLVLAGVVVNNGIVFVDYVNQLRLEGVDKHTALMRAGTDRMRPILMTALTTILAMSTMAFGVGMGAEMSRGMAIVSIGGLSYATLLTLFLVPALYDIMHKKEVKNIDDLLGEDVE